MTKRFKYNRQLRAEKVNPQYQGMTVIDGMQQPRSMPRNYKSYIKEGYTVNDTLYKVVNYAITNGAAIPPVLFKDKTMKSGRIDHHPLLEKLEQPNNEWTGVFFRKAVIGYFLLAGNSFLFCNRVANSGPPDELWILPPDRVKPIPDQRKGIVGYEYEDWPKEKNPIPSHLIGHLRTWNPEDLFFGMSPVQVAAIMIDQQTDARKWNLSLFQNFLKPPGAWTTPSLLSPNERSKLEARINEKMAGFRNAGKTPVLDGALKFEPSAVNPSEMDWITSMKFNSGAIANVYNMPPQLIGDTSSTTYDNYEQAEIVSYTEFIFPTLDDYYGLLNKWLVPMYPDLVQKKAFLYYDKDTVEVVQKVIQAQKDAQSERGNKLWLSGLAMQDEAREMASLPPLANGVGQVFRVGALLIPASKVGEYAEQCARVPPRQTTVTQEVPPVVSDATQELLQEDVAQDVVKAYVTQEVPVVDVTQDKAHRRWELPSSEWYPENIHEMLDAQAQRGVKQVRWLCVGEEPCALCLQNNGVTVKLGKAFPSGALLAPQHPHCKCETMDATKKATPEKRDTKMKDIYKQFMEMKI